MQFCFTPKLRPHRCGGKKGAFELRFFSRSETAVKIEADQVTKAFAVHRDAVLVEFSTQRRRAARLRARVTLTAFMEHSRMREISEGPH